MLFALVMTVLPRAEMDGFVMTYWGPWDIEAGVGGLDRAQAMGAHTVSILVHLCQETRTSSALTYCDGYGVPFKDSYQYQRLEKFKPEMQKRGLRFNLMPFIMTGDGQKRQGIWPDNLDAWFDSYTDKALELARYATDAGNTSFILASELASMYPVDWKWRTLIDRVREVFPGHITVSTLIGTHELVTFWDALDSIGVSAYFPLAVFKSTRAVWALETAWRAHKAHLMTYSNAWGRPLYFVELGYPSTDVAAVKPWDYEWASRSRDDDLQQRCYEAFRRVWNNERRLIGFMIWGMSDPATDTVKTFSPWGKPAESTVRATFAQRGVVP